MMRTWPILWLGWLCALPHGFAQTPSAGDDLACNYLFLIDTSFSMTRLKPAMTNALAVLVASGANGRMRPGETFTLWTFNEEVQPHRFPKQTWNPEQGRALAARVTQFLKSQRFEKQTHLDKAVTDMLSAVRAAKSMTVFMFSDGDDRIAGTPFDRSLNLLYQEQGRNARRARKPLITTFVAKDGRLLAWAVSLAGGPIDIPDVLNPTPLAEQPPPKPSPRTNLFSSEIAVQPLSKPAVAGEKQSVAAPVQTNAPSQLQTPPTIAARPPTNPSASVEESSPPKSAEPPPIVQLQPIRTTAEPASAKTPPPDPQPQIMPNSAVSTFPRNEAPSPPIPVAAKPEPPPLTTQQQEDINPSPSPLVAKTDTTKDLPPSKTSDHAKLPDPSTNQQTLAVTTEPKSNAQILLLAGVVLLLVALCLAYGFLKSSRSHDRPSLISRSLNREDE